MHLVRFLAACLGALALVACQSPWPGGTGGAGRLQKILEGRELRVGLTASQPPLNMRNRSGEIIGLEVDVVNTLADSMGLEPRFIVKPFAELLPALEAGEVDMVISGMTITPERNARVAFVGPYFVSGKSLLTKDEKLSKLEKIEALDDPARTYAALAGSTSESFVREMAPRATLVTTADYAAAVAMVMDGSVDAMVADFPACMVPMLRNPDAGLSTLVTPFTLEPLGIALPSGDPLLVNLVTNYVATLERTGLLTRYKARWFSEGTWLSELP